MPVGSSVLLQLQGTLRWASAIASLDRTSRLLLYYLDIGRCTYTETGLKLKRKQFALRDVLF